MEPNLYSSQWFEFFHASIGEMRTIRETDFVCDCAPRPAVRNIADVYCGTGRHARELSRRGYAVTGIDRDTQAIAKARELGGGPNYILADVRNHEFEPQSFDAAIVMGQSFGHFDAATNRNLFSRLAKSIRKDGRIVLDLWNPDFFAAHQGERELKSPKGITRETKRVDGERLFVELKYPDGAVEKFEWQLFSPHQMERLANSIGVLLLTSCSGFDATRPPPPSEPRIQFVLERSDNR